MVCVAYHGGIEKKSQIDCLTGTEKGSPGNNRRHENAPNYGSQYLQRFENMFPQLAEELNIPLLPFLLEGVGVNPR